MSLQNRNSMQTINTYNYRGNPQGQIPHSEVHFKSKSISVDCASEYRGEGDGGCTDLDIHVTPPYKTPRSVNTGLLGPVATTPPPHLCLAVDLTKEGRRFQATAMVDSGATRNFVYQEVRHRLQIPVRN